MVTDKCFHGETDTRDEFLYWSEICFVVVFLFFTFARCVTSVLSHQDKWKTYANTNETFELFKDVSLMALDTIMKCAFSQNSNCQTKR